MTYNCNKLQYINEGIIKLKQKYISSKNIKQKRIKYQNKNVILYSTKVS